MTTAKHTFILIFAILLTFFGRTNELFNRGLKLANEKKYSAASKVFEQIIAAENSNTSAYFNLGNCYYKSNQYGKAIWAYERVIKYSPRDGEAPKQMELCYQKLNSTLYWTPHTNGIQRLIYSVNSNVWSILAIASSIFLAILFFLIIRNKNTSWKRFHLLLLIGGTILLISFVIAAKSSSNHLTSQNFGLVTKKSIPTFINEVIKKKETQLSEGTKVKILNTSGNKTQIQMDDGRVVYVLTDDIDPI